MKLLTAVLALVAMALANEEWQPKTVEEFKAIRADCLKDHPLSDEFVQKMKQFEYPDEEPVRKYLLCTSVKTGIFCEHEGFHADRVTKQFKMDLEESEVLPIVQGCIDKNEQGSPADVWAFRGHKCLINSKVFDRIKAYIKNRQEIAAKTT